MMRWAGPAALIPLLALHLAVGVSGQEPPGAADHVSAGQAALELRPPARRAAWTPTRWSAAQVRLGPAPVPAPGRARRGGPPALLLTLGHRLGDRREASSPVAAGALIGAGAGALVGVVGMVAGSDADGDAPLLPLPLLTVPAGALIGALVGAAIR